MNHSPEPWEFTPDSIIAGEVCIANLETDGGYEAEPQTIDANGKRIVECVNACAGVEDPAKVLQDVRASLKFVIHHHNLDCETCLERIEQALALLTPKP